VCPLSRPQGQFDAAASRSTACGSARPTLLKESVE
jgi:hypothetical protein